MPGQSFQYLIFYILKPNMSLNCARPLLIASLIGCFSACFGQVSIDSYQYKQDFNSLAKSGQTNEWKNNVTLAGWYAFREIPRDTFAAASIYRTDTGAQQGLYSFGAQTGDGVTDRALGAVTGVNTAIGGDFYFGMGFRNQLNSPITSISLSFMQETWRVGSIGIADFSRFEFSSNALGINDQNANWVNIASLDLTPDVFGVAGPVGVEPNRTERQGSLSGFSLETNSTLWIRWVDRHVTGGTLYGLGVDDLEVNFHTASAAPVPEPATLILSGFAATCAARRVKSRRAKQQASR